MAAYLITYDLNKETKRPKIVDRIKDAGSGWARLSESSYAITTNASPSQVFSMLEHLIDKDDYLYVIPLMGPWEGYGPGQVVSFLENNLPY
jgi:hypothetical protein